MSTENLSMSQHPDITALREKYDQTAETGLAQATDGLTLMAGLYVAMSPWIVGFDAQPGVRLNDLITGLAVAVLAIGLAAAFSRTHTLGWTLPLMGVWVIICPWVIAGVSTTTGMIVSNVVGGAVILLTGLGTLGIGMFAKRRMRA